MFWLRELEFGSEPFPALLSFFCSFPLSLLPFGLSRERQNKLVEMPRRVRCIGFRFVFAWDLNIKKFHLFFVSVWLS